MSAQYGLTIRWSLAEAPDGVEEALADYIAGTSHARFTAMQDLCFKVWRMRRGEWFEGCYVFVDEAARVAFQEGFVAMAADSAGSQIIGSSPILIEECEIFTVAEGVAGFQAFPPAVAGAS